MSIYQNVAFTQDSYNGILQTMKSNNETDKFELSSSSNADSLNGPSNILVLNGNYFCSQTNESKNANYVIVTFKDRVIYPKGYIIKSHCNNFPMSWKLYGSLPGTSWMLLHSVDNKTYLSGGSFGRFKISGGPFSTFKIVQTGPANGSADSDKIWLYRLRLSYFDVFGLMTNKVLMQRERTCKTQMSTKLFVFSMFCIYSS